MNEQASSSALFLRSLTQSWSKKESIDLITYLDAVLKWNSNYLQEVMAVYASSIFGENNQMVPTQNEPEALPRPSPSEANEFSKASQRLVWVLVFLTSRLKRTEGWQWPSINWRYLLIGRLVQNAKPVTNVRF
jgi:hypothetical protein